MENNIWIVGLEPIETRYTSQWEWHIPNIFSNKGYNVQIIEGEKVSINPSPGAFLDFTATNIFKSSQLQVIAELFQNNEVKDGDIFFYTDAWNPTVLQLKYMASLLEKKIKVIGLLHAGAYDPNDFLGRLVGSEKWMQNCEVAIFAAFDKIFVATEYHKKLLSKNYNLNNIIISGFPFDYLPKILEPYLKLNKKNQIVFPHRISIEKQVDIFKDLAKSLPEYEFIICQEKTLTKHEYYTIMGESKLCFSSALQETLGIGLAESIYSNGLVICPDYLSYSEIYHPIFKYPSEWINGKYHENKHLLISHIQYLMEISDNSRLKMVELQKIILKKYFTSDCLLERILNDKQIPKNDYYEFINDWNIE